MNRIDNLLDDLITRGYNFFVGVPDSTLKPFINAIINIGVKHIMATNEGQAMGIAVGAELAGKKSCVYLQNSGLGNIINPLTSLCIPCNIKPLLIIGHRHSLPQHLIMGNIDKQLLTLIGYTDYILINGDNNAK